MQGQLFQLLDTDGEDVGLIWTDLEGDRDYLEKDWKDYYSAENTDNPNADDFADLLNEKYPEASFERVFVTTINFF